MKKEIELLLYSTAGCHLCDVAEQVIAQSVAQSPSTEVEIYLSVIDIAEDDQLMAQYAEHIPVLRKMHSEVVLCWPFSGDDVLRLIRTG